MANVKFSRKEFEKYLGEKISSDIEEKISSFGTPLESLNSEELEIEIFPNRPDLLSLPRYVTALRTFLDKQTTPKYKINKPEKNFLVNVDSSIKKTSRPYVVCAIVKNLNLNDEKIKDLINFQEKIHSTLGRNRKKLAIGIYPLEKIKLPITFKAMKPSDIKFKPLEARKEMTATQVLKQHPKGKEYAHLLSYDKNFPVFIDSNNNILSMPPIINSHDTGKISKDTKEAFIECSGENLDLLKKTLNIIVACFAQMGCTIYSMEVRDKNKFVTPEFTEEKIKLSLEKVNETLGTDLKENQIKKLLSRMEHEYSSGIVTIAPWRTDILQEIDIVEDIAIAYGYNNFKPEMPKISTTGLESKSSILKSKISETLIGLGLLEISTYHLVKQEELKRDDLKEQIQILDSKTEYKYLRQNLLTSLLRVLSENTDSDYPQRIFEIGKVFSLDSESESGIKEKTKLIIGITPGNFTEVKQILDYLSKMISIEYNLEEDVIESLIEGRTGKIIISGKTVGFLGEVHPNELKAWKLKMPLSVIELDFDKISNLMN